MATVAFENVTRTYPGSDHPAIADLSLDIADGEFLVLVGPSGCGKSTSLRLLAGIEEMDEGVIRIGGQDVSTVAPKDRDVAMVFQNYALYPHMTVAANMGFGLRISRRPKQEIRTRVAEAARILALDTFLERKPGALSGGQRQRVAMGRAIVRDPQVFLMDEPLSNLDAQLRVQTRAQIAALQRRLGTTTVYVTHDQVEAMTMGDRVAVLADGRLQQVDAPRRLYDRPANASVARFIGSPSMNLRDASLTENGAQLVGQTIALDRDVLTAAVGRGLDRVLLGFRPEALELVPNGGEGFTVITHLTEELGADVYLYGLPESEQNAGSRDAVPYLVARLGPRDVPGEGTPVRLRIRPGEIHVFAPDSGDRLN
jgi:multiple sugar transport system ATP-binding protein